MVLEVYRLLELTLNNKTTFMNFAMTLGDVENRIKKR